MTKQLIKNIMSDIYALDAMGPNDRTQVEIILQKHLSLSQQEEKLCESDGMVYTSNPPQSKCKYCGKFWIDKIPVCGKLEQEEPKQIDWIMVEMMPGVNREVKNIEQTIQLLLDTINRQQEQIDSLLSKTKDD